MINLNYYTMFNWNKRIIISFIHNYYVHVLTLKQISILSDKPINLLVSLYMIIQVMSFHMCKVVSFPYDHTHLGWEWGLWGVPNMGVCLSLGHVL